VNKIFGIFSLIIAFTTFTSMIYIAIKKFVLIEHMEIKDAMKIIASYFIASIIIVIFISLLHVIFSTFF